MRFSLLRDLDLLLFLDELRDIVFVLEFVRLRLRLRLLLLLGIRVRDLDDVIVGVRVSELVCEIDPVPLEDGLADAVCDELGVLVRD